MSNTSRSFASAAWKRLKKNKGALVGLFIICIALLVALFAYFIAPDKTPNANRIIVEIDGEKPGFRQQFILVKKEDQHSTSFIQQLLFGREDKFSFIPISGYQEKGDSIIIQKFIDEGVSERQAFSKKQLPDHPVQQVLIAWARIVLAVIF